MMALVQGPFGQGLSGIVTLQLLYFLAGAAMNVVSVLRIRAGRKRLTPNNPLIGIRTMGIALLVTLSVIPGLGTVYLLGWSYLGQRIARRGLLPHIRAAFTGRGLENYSSLAPAVWAAAINLAGVLLAAVGVLFMVLRMVALSAQAVPA